MSNFEVHAGNARIYQLPKEKVEAERARMDAQAAKGGNTAFLADAPTPTHDGFLMVDQTLVNYLQTMVDAGEGQSVRLNWKGYRDTTSSGLGVIKLQDIWTKESGAFKDYKKNGDLPPLQAPVAQPAQAEEDPFAEDIPF
jgi:hypothetical protein